MQSFLRQGDSRCTIFSCFLSALVILACPGPANLAAAPDTTQAGLPFATVSGRVVDFSTRAPVTQATVTLSSESSAERRTSTDAGGKFEFERVPSGPYKCTVAAPNYLPGGYGQLWPGGPVGLLEVRTSEAQDITIAAWKYAAVRGTVRSPSGEPIPNASIQLIARDIVGNGRSLVVRAASTGRNGAFSFGDITPGRYSVGLLQSYRVSCPPALSSGCVLNADRASMPPVRLADGRTLVYVTTFYPSTPDIDGAEVMTLHSGEDRVGVDFVASPVPGPGLSGTVRGADGPVRSALVSVTRLTNSLSDFGAILRYAVASTDASGRFSIPTVPAGDYELRVEAYPIAGTGTPARRFTDARGNQVVGGTVGGLAEVSDDNPLLVARTTVSIERTNVDEVNLVAQPAPSLTGITVFARQRRGPAPQTISSLSAGLSPVTQGSGPPVRAQLNADGGFRFPSVAPALYLFAPSRLPGWTLASLRVDGKPSPYGIVDLRQGGTAQIVQSLTDRAARVAGRVEASGSRPPVRAGVFLFPYDRSAWTYPATLSDAFAMVRSSADGSFLFNAVPRGDYLILAVATGSLESDWRNADVLAQFARRATKLSIGEEVPPPITIRPISF